MGKGRERNVGISSNDNGVGKWKSNRLIDLLEEVAEKADLLAFFEAPLFMRFVTEWKEHPSVRLPDFRLSARLYLKLEALSGF